MKADGQKTEVNVKTENQKVDVSVAVTLEKIQTKIEGMTSSIKSMNSKLDTMQKDLTTERILHQKAESESEALKDKVGDLTKRVSNHTEQLHVLESKSSTLSGRVVGIGLAFTGLMSLFAVLLELLKIAH